MRRPVRSHNVTDRKLFNRGGFPTMGAQAQMPNPANIQMGGNLPQANNIAAPSGILASSAPLADQVAETALSQSFAPTVGMNSGGIASFANGGGNNFPGQEYQDKFMGYLKDINLGLKEPAQRFKKSIIDYGRSYLPPILGGKAYDGPGEDEVIQSTVNATSYGEPFGVSKSFDWEPIDTTTNIQTFRGAFNVPVITGDIGYQNENVFDAQPPPPTEMNVQTWFNEAAWQTADRIFPGANVSKIPSVEKMIWFMKMGQKPYANEIDVLSKSILSENPDINPMDFREQMAVGLKTMIEADNSGVQDIITEAEQESAAALLKAEELEANKVDVNSVIESLGEIVVYPEKEIDASIVGENEINTDIDLALSQWKARNYSSAFIEELRDQGKTDEFLGELISRVDPDKAASEQETNYTTVYDENVGTGEKEIVPADSVRNIKDFGDLTPGETDPYAPTGGEGFDTPGYNAAGLENIEAPQNQMNIVAPDAQKEVEKLNKRNKELATKQATEANVVEAASIAGDEIFVQQARGDGQEAVNDTLDKFAKEFMDRMPKFKGKTENEKGWDLIMLGSAIMGGTSPNALKNIAEGFLATGDRFTEDDKAKRVYDNSIQMGAAKYSLQKLATQEARDAADERNITWMVASEDLTYEGKKYSKGTTIPINMTTILKDGVPPNLTTQTLYSAALKSVSDANTLYNKLVTEKNKTIQDTITKNTISRGEEVKLLEKNSKLMGNYKSSVTGRLYLNRAIDILNLKENTVVGGSSVLKEAWHRFKNAFNFDYKTPWGEKDSDGNAWDAIDPETREYTNTTRQAFNMNVRIAFQNLIPVALSGVQSANSISNRDVQFLADAFIVSGALDEKGLLSDTWWKSADTIKAQLNATNDIFLKQEQGYLTDMQKEFDALAGRYRPMVTPGKEGAPGVARASSYVSENVPYEWDYSTGLRKKDEKTGELIPNKNWIGNYEAQIFKKDEKKWQASSYKKGKDGKWRLQ